MHKIRAFAGIAAIATAACIAAPALAAADTADTATAQAGRAPLTRPAHPPHTLAASAARSLREDDVPSVHTYPERLSARADADLAARGATAAPTRRLHAERENLKGPDAAAALARQSKPSTYDREIANGDIDHTQQVTDLKISLKKK